MKLLTKTQINLFKKIGNQSDKVDPMVIMKLFDPCSGATWYCIEYYPGEETFFGYVTGLGEDELGYFSLKELESYKGKLGIGIERDLHFTMQPLSKIK